MSNGNVRAGLARLFEVSELPDVQASTSLLSNLLGVKGRQGIRYSPVLVPGLDAETMLLQAISETIFSTVNITAALGNVAGSVYTLYTVPDTEHWRTLDGVLTTDVLDADQNTGAAGLVPIYSDRPLAAGLPAGILGFGLTLAALASQIGGAAMFLSGVEPPWIRAGGAIGFVLRAPVVLGVAAAMTINARLRFARMKL